jgi:hypothetical protein
MERALHHLLKAARPEGHGVVLKYGLKSWLVAVQLKA